MQPSQVMEGNEISVMLSGEERELSEPLGLKGCLRYKSPISFSKFFFHNYILRVLELQKEQDPKVSAGLGSRWEASATFLDRYFFIIIYNVQ